MSFHFFLLLFANQKARACWRASPLLPATPFGSAGGGEGMVSK
jgi:hypothetical protein